ncbi:hypothetical protein E4U15_006452 [Claviceps sp. LM218 group G6]|nr:hypothetical protein E4U15_006452 [Claviceps sp. LM218 group G6]
MSPSTTHDELFDAGMKIRKEVAGEAYVSRALQGGQSEFAYPQQQLITEGFICLLPLDLEPIA